MYFFLANIQLVINDYRKRPITGNPYRPILVFSDTVIRSGWIVVEEGEILEMGGFYPNRKIAIYFYEDINPQKEFCVNRPFIISDGPHSIGRGIITEVIGLEE